MNPVETSSPVTIVSGPFSSRVYNLRSHSVRPRCDVCNKVVPGKWWIGQSAGRDWEGDKGVVGACCKTKLDEAQGGAMQYHLSYAQTRGERFDSDMNDVARRLIQAYGVAIEAESGGTNLATGVADQSFTVTGTYTTVKAVADALSAQLKRTIEMEASS